MLFNSLEFILFLPTVFLLYWFVFQKSLRIQNFLLLVASYVFYGWWDWRFLSLIFISSIVDYAVGLKLHKEEVQWKRKALLITSLVVNLGFLGFFKYFNFFIDSFAHVLNSVGVSANLPSLKIILPVGISFYTFQTLSYSIDIYRKNLEPVHDIVGFFAFVSFFPQLVAGPIERASNLLPQFEKERKFEYAKAADGMRQILWGFFKKIVVADCCAANVNYIFSNYTELNSFILFLGVFFFAFQIYGDFSGYSDIAIGTARLFGFDLMRNFAYPYFSRDIAEFWRRWHISLSTWFRDYVYIPLGGSRGGKSQHLRNLILTFTISGFWHGASWTFIFWGFLNGLYYVPLMLMNKQKEHTAIVAENSFLPSVKELLQILGTFALVLLAWVFFRADTITEAFVYLQRVFMPSNYSFSIDQIVEGSTKRTLFVGLLGIIILQIFEWIQRRKQHGLAIKEYPMFFRWTLYIGIGILIIFFGRFQGDAFIYFQF